MSNRKPFVGGNWKMNTEQASASDLSRGVADALLKTEGVEVAVFPPFPYLLTVGSILKARAAHVVLGAQDVWHEGNGAFTGEVSVEMLSDCGVGAVLLGHSERRHVVGEDDALIAKKLRATLAGGLTAVLCVGETLEQREAGETDTVNEWQVRAGLSELGADQLASVVVAYEPVWAIGTGKTASPEDAQAAHQAIRGVVSQMFGEGEAARLRIIYGGSMKPQNAAELMAQPDIDGGLIGGASLKAEDFSQIVAAAAP